MTRKRTSVIGMGKDIFKEADIEEDHPIENFVTNKANIINLRLDQIFPNPDQPRKFFNEDALIELSESIKSHGVLQPIIVKKFEKDTFILVAGERRYRAAKLAKLDKIPALIRFENPLEIAMIENIQRENLKPLEEAEGLQMLIDRFDYTHEDLGKVIGKSRTSVTEILSLNKLPEQIKSECRTSDKYSKSLLLHVVREQKELKMLRLWEKIKKGNLTVRQAGKNLKKKDKRMPFFYRFFSPEKDFSLVIRFRGINEVKPEMVKGALEKAMEDLKLKYNMK